MGDTGRMNLVLNIGVDLDSTLIEAHAVNNAAKKLGYNISQKDQLTWNKHEFPKDLQELILEYYALPAEMCHAAIPIEGAQAKIKDWSERGHNVILITARGENLKDETISMVNRLFPEIKEICFSGYNEPKASIMSDKKLDIWVDDAAHGIEEAIELGIDCYLVSNNNTKYNHSIPVKHAENPKLKGVVKIISDIKDF